MSRRLLIIIIGVAVLVIPAVITAIIINRSPKLQNTILNIANINGSANANVSANVNTTVNINSPIAAEQEAMTFVSRNFVETYGSGSNQNNFSNITEAKKFGTTNFNAFLDREIIRQRGELKTGDPYHEILTTALVFSVTSQSTTTAKLTVSTQRQETVGDNVTIYYQDILLDLLKVNNDWKINAAVWKAVAN